VEWIRLDLIGLSYRNRSGQGGLVSESGAGHGRLGLDNKTIGYFQQRVMI